MQVGRAGYSQTTDYYDVGEVSKMLIEGYSKFAPGDTSARFNAVLTKVNTYRVFYTLTYHVRIT